MILEGQEGKRFVVAAVTSAALPPAWFTILDREYCYHEVAHANARNGSKASSARGARAFALADRFEVESGEVIA